MRKGNGVYPLPWLYRLCYIWVALYHRLYYRRYTVAGKENIPKGVPVIFAPNHQNALMDALAVLFAKNRSVGYLARADIFKKPAVAALLRFLKILPIFRIRDGYGNLKENQEIFDKTISVLKSGMPICILPEGTHEGFKRLRTLKKGISRIAFQAENSTDFSLNTHIVPVGIDYSNYFNAGTDLLVVFGRPIRVADYKSLYVENEAIAHNKLMSALETELRKVMIDIPEQHYNAINQLSQMAEPIIWNRQNKPRHPYNKLVIKQFIIQKLQTALEQNAEALNKLETELADYNRQLKILNFRDRLSGRKPESLFSILVRALLFIIVLPVHIYGMLLNYIAYKVPVMIARKTKDLHFRSSMNFGISLFMFPPYYAVIITIFGLIVRNPLLTLAFGLSLPVCGMIAFYNYKRMIKLLASIRYWYFRKTKPGQFQALQNQRKAIINQSMILINQ